MRDGFNKALKEAIKAQDKRRMSTLRLITAALKDREIAQRSNGKDGLSDNEILEVLSRMIKQRRESKKVYEEGGRLELAAQEQEEMDIISEFLPAQLSGEEIRAACESVVAETGAQSLKDMGRTMGELKKRHAGKMDFGKASAVVKELLG